MSTLRMGVSTRKWFQAAVAIVAFAVPARAHGAPEAPIVVLKARVGLAPPGATDDLTPLLDDQFEAEGFAARPATIAAVVGGLMPRPGILDEGLTANDIMHQVERGYDDWAHGLFAHAEEKLTAAIEKIHRNPALLVTDTKNQDTTFKGLVALALSQMKLGKTAQSTETMLTLLRMFVSRPISRMEYGPPAEQFYRAVSRQALAGGRGELVVTTGNAKAVIFVDGQIRGIGKAAVADMIPGTHRVFVQVPSTIGRQYELQIEANEETTLDAAWDVDMSLAVTAPWIGFVFTTEVERNKEALFAGQLARRWPGRGMVAVVSTVQIQGKPVVIGTVYRAGGAMYRSAATTLDGDRRALLRSLAKYLADGTASPSLNVIETGTATSTPVLVALASARQPGRRSKLIVAGGTLAIAAGGAAYLVRADDYTQPTHDDWDNPAATIMVSGSVAVGTGIYLWLRESRGGRRRSAAALGAGVAAMAVGGTLIFIDQDPRTVGRVRQYYRDSAPSGVIIGTAGATAVGIGLWMLRRESSTATKALTAHETAAPSLPFVSISASQTAIGWAGRF